MRDLSVAHAGHNINAKHAASVPTASHSLNLSVPHLGRVQEQKRERVAVGRATMGGQPATGRITDVTRRYVR